MLLRYIIVVSRTGYCTDYTGHRQRTYINVVAQAMQKQCVRIIAVSEGRRTALSRPVPSTRSREVHEPADIRANLAEMCFISTRPLRPVLPSHRHDTPTACSLQTTAILYGVLEGAVPDDKQRPSRRLSRF